MITLGTPVTGNYLTDQIFLFVAIIILAGCAVTYVLDSTPVLKMGHSARKVRKKFFVVAAIVVIVWFWVQFAAPIITKAAPLVASSLNLFEWGVLSALVFVFVWVYKKRLIGNTGFDEGKAGSRARLKGLFVFAPIFIFFALAAVGQSKVAGIFVTMPVMILSFFAALDCLGVSNR